MRNATRVLMALVLLAGCAATKPRLVSDVTAHSHWVIARKPSTYVFERVPEQQARAGRQQEVEDAARVALEAAGFSPVSDGTSADVVVQVGARARVTRQPGSSAATRHRAVLPGSANHLSTLDTDYLVTDIREVALLIRDGESGDVLYAGRASNRGRSVSARAILRAMFEATMKPFPSGSVDRREVTIELCAEASCGQGG